MTDTPKPLAKTIIGWGSHVYASQPQPPAQPAQPGWGDRTQLDMYPPQHEEPPLQGYAQQGLPRPQQPGYPQPGYEQPPQAWHPQQARPEDYMQPGYLQPYGQSQLLAQPNYPAQQGYPQPQQSDPNAQQPFAQQPYAQQPYAQQPYAQQPQHKPYAQQPYAQQPAYPQQSPQPAYAQQSAYAQQPSGAPLQTAPAPATSASGKPKLRAKVDATAGVSDRVRFIRLTYLHLLLAILAFAGLEYLLMTNELLVRKVSIPFVTFALGGRWNWGIVLLGFMAVSWVADYWASHSVSRPVQYLGLAFYIVAEAVIFVPLLAIVAAKTHAILERGGQDPNIIRDSAYVTLAIFGALTASVFLTKKDFSFLRSGLMMVSGAALTLIGLSLVFGFNLGLVFSIAMVLLAAGYILYQTSQVLAHYDPSQYVAASLALFSSVALMFWYVIRIFLRARN